MIIKFNQEEILKALKLGQLICFPTDTLFALSCDASNDSAIKSLMACKNRDFKKTMPVLVADVATAQSIAEFNPLALKLANSFWPGPLTLILKAKNNTKISKLLIAEDGTIGIRIPNNQMALSILKFGPLVGTSANLSGHNNTTSITEIENNFDNVKIVKSTLTNPSPCPSTIVKISNGELELIREGGIKIKEIMEVLQIEVF